MPRYFKIVEIDEDDFKNSTGEELDCIQVCVPLDGCVYVGVDDEDEYEMRIPLDMI